MLGIPFLDSAFLKLFSPSTYDDRVDRLNYFVTASLLTFFAILVSAKQYVGSPIQCWMPMEFKGGWEEYAEDYCFIQNTYWVSFKEDVPKSVENRHEAEIGYYQWVPIVLALQALMFFIPAWIWKTLNKQSGKYFMPKVCLEAKNVRASRCEDRKTEISKLSAYIAENLEFDLNRSSRRLFIFNFGRSLGSYCSGLYLIVKLLYVINIVVQFIILNNFLGADHNLWGFATMYDLWAGKEWSDSGVFPRVTMCDFSIRRLANLHRYTVQCVLMINMFNEKIYLFIWFWFLFVAISTVMNCLYWFFTLFFSRNREKTARTMLSNLKLNDSIIEDRNILRQFVHKGLRPDGILLLRFIDTYAGGMTARDICAQLFVSYFGDEHYVRAAGSQTTKSTSPGIDEGFTEGHYNSDKLSGPLLQPDAGYPGPPKSKNI
uniref:Innexin n=1 Tax=Syphacia muris TaxID=451379 RepID=A0A0N5A9F0_9BILA